MERKKFALIELPELEKEIINLCVFTESFHNICDECKWTSNQKIIADAIKNLLHHKLLIAVNIERGNFSWMYDGDKMKESSFRLTAKGMDYLAL